MSNLDYKEGRGDYYRNEGRHEERLALEQRWPCLPNERHTFLKASRSCLCGVLNRGGTTTTEVATFYPNPSAVPPSKKVTP